MKPLTRFGSAAAIVLPVLAGVTVLMSGCGGSSTTAQSTVQGSYNGVWVAEGAPTAEAASGAVSMTIDSHGRLTGSFNNNGTISFLDATLKNSGDFTGTVSPQAVGGSPAPSYSVSGHFNPQQVDQTALQALLPAYTPNATPTPTPSASGSSSDVYKAGLAGDFRETIGGVDYAGTFQVIGGSTSAS